MFDHTDPVFIPADLADFGEALYDEAYGPVNPGLHQLRGQRVA